MNQPPAPVHSQYRKIIHASLALLFMTLNLNSLSADNPANDFMALRDFAKKYEAAWSSQDPAQLAALYSPDGVLIVNGGEPAAGRAAVEEKARGFMEAFPDMKVEMIAVQKDGEGARFDWHWTGTNTGPGGTGRPVNLKGFETWTFGSDGLIKLSEGSYDEADYPRQLNPGQ